MADTREPLKKYIQKSQVFFVNSKFQVLIKKIINISIDRLTTVK